MNWALKSGGWKSHRLSAIDAADNDQKLLALPNLFQAGTKLPGLYRSEEPESSRRTSRPELACLASWKRLLLNSQQIDSPSGWLLLMEDDVGASLARPAAWAHSLIDLIEFCPKQTLAIQLYPTNAKIREKLAQDWEISQGKCIAVNKEIVHSHGNAAILLNKKALEILIDPLQYFANYISKNWHPMLHPWKIRPVADKWLYGTLPPGSCQVATYPHFCLDAENSALHPEHVEAFHRPSRAATINIWERDNRKGLLESQKFWESISETP